MDNKTTKQLNYKYSLLKEWERKFNRNVPFNTSIIDRLQSMSLVELALVGDMMEIAYQVGAGR